MIINNAVILAGGLGSRAQSKINRTYPKVLFKVNDKPILQRNIEILRDQLNIKSITLIIGFEEQLIKNYFKNGDELGVQINYVKSKPNFGIADALLLAKEKINGMFIVMLGDEFYFNSTHHTILESNCPDYDALITYMKSDNPQSITNNYSIKMDENKKVLSLIEKPRVVDNDFLGLGTFILNDKIFSYLETSSKNPKTGKRELIDVISNYAKNHNVYAHELQGSYVNINTVDDWYHAKYISNESNFNSFKKTLIIPTYNENDSIIFVLNDFKKFVDEIIIADGGSTDGTLKKIINHAKSDNKIKLIQKRFRGYGDAIRTGIDNATGDIVILVEGDATFRSRDISKMFEYIKDCDMVIGTRTTKQMINQGANMSTWLRIANLAVAKVIELLWWGYNEPRLTDVGCTYRTFWKKEYDEIKQNFVGTGPEFSPEMMIEFIRNNNRIIEIPVSYYGRISGQSKHSESTVAIIKTGLKMISLIFKKRLSK